MSSFSRTHNQRQRWKVSLSDYHNKVNSEFIELFESSGGTFFKIRVEFRSRSSLQVDDYQKLKRPETYSFSPKLLISNSRIPLLIITAEISGLR